MAAYKTVLGRVKHQLQESTSSFISPLAGEILILEQNNKYRLYVGTSDEQGTTVPIDYVTISSNEYITGAKTFIESGGNQPPRITLENSNNQVGLYPDKLVISNRSGETLTSYTLLFPDKENGATERIATLSDIAGGVELVGTYDASSYNLEFALVPAH